MLGLKNLIRRTVSNHTTGEQHHPFRTFGFFQVVGREDDRRPTVNLLVHDSEDGLLAREVEAGDRFVE